MELQLLFPSRYYCRWPFKEPRGYQEEIQRLDVRETALLVVDVYGKGYDEGDPVPEYPALFFDQMFLRERDVIRNRIVPSLEAARRAGLPVVYTTNYWPRAGWDQSEFGKMCQRTETGWAGTLEGSIGGDSDYVAFSNIISPRAEDYVVNKTMYDGFFGTYLDVLLRNMQVKNLVCVGFTADICLLNTAIGALYRNYRVVVLRDCTLGAEFADTLEDMRMTWFGIRCVEAMVGFTATSEAFIEACGRISKSGEARANADRNA